MGQPEVESLTRYLRAALGVEISVSPYPEAKRLPHFLQQRYSFFAVSLCEADSLLMMVRGEEPTPGAVGKHIRLVREKTGRQPIYVPTALSPHRRRRLVEQKIPFVVPGNQMFLPPLGIDFREYFRRERSIADHFMPATQVVVLSALGRGGDEPYSPSLLATRLAYSPMTLSRAFNEIEKAGLGETSKHGRERLLHFPQGRRALWDRAKPFLRSPVTKRLHIREPGGDWSGLEAGLTALARYTSLAPPGGRSMHCIAGSGRAFLDVKRSGSSCFPKPRRTHPCWSCGPIVLACWPKAGWWIAFPCS